MHTLVVIGHQKKFFVSFLKFLSFFIADLENYHSRAVASPNRFDSLSSPSTPPRVADEDEDACKAGARPKKSSCELHASLHEELESLSKRLPSWTKSDLAKLASRKRVATGNRAFPAFFSTRQEAESFIFNRMHFNYHYRFLDTSVQLSYLPQFFYDLLSFDTQDRSESLINRIRLSNDDSAILRIATELSELRREFTEKFRCSARRDRGGNSIRAGILAHVDGDNCEAIRRDFGAFFTKSMELLKYCEQVQEVVAVAAQVEQLHRRYPCKHDDEGLGRMCDALSDKFDRRLLSDFVDLLFERPIELIFQDAESYVMTRIDWDSGSVLYWHTRVGSKQRFDDSLSSRKDLWCGQKVLARLRIQKKQLDV